MTAAATIAKPLARKDKREYPLDSFAFSGHQTFPLRISWLTKAADAVLRGEDPFKDPRVGTRHLGIGKNMVEALSCWTEFFGVLIFEPKTGAPSLTEFGRLVFGKEGHDRYLEDEQTLWLLHWESSAGHGRRLFAWHWLFNLQLESRFSRNDALRIFRQQGESAKRVLSEVTLRQHLEVFLGTYIRSTPVGKAGLVAEDFLESPLASLSFIQEGDRQGGRGSDPVYLIDSDVKNGISDELFRYSVHSWWNRRTVTDETASHRELCHGENSPGRVFRMPEHELHDRFQRLVANWPKEFAFQEHNQQRQIRRLTTPRLSTLLLSIYTREV